MSEFPTRQALTVSWYKIVVGIRQMLQRRRNRKQFPAYLSPEVIEKLQREAKEAKSPEVKHFQFVLILLDDTNTQEVLARIGTVIDTLLRHRASVSNITSSLLVGLLGVPFQDGNTPEARRELVSALLEDHGDRIRIAHGECDGAFGVYGSKKRFTCGEVIPGFSGFLKTLLETRLGTAVEVPGWMSSTSAPD